MMPRMVWATLIVAILIAAGMGFEQVQRRRDRDRFPQVGRSVDIGGRSLNLYCSGEGMPAVILESDGLTPGYGWVAVQRAIATFTHACWYDRAGYGWSDPAPAPHTSTASAQDLHTLLQGAGLAPPYVLAGAGFGAFNVRVFCGLYPDEVAGVVLIDAHHEDEWEEERGGASRIPFGLGYPPDWLLRTARVIGLTRLAAPPNRTPLNTDGLTQSERDTLEGLARRASMRAALMAEQGFSAAPAEAHAAGGLGDRPLIVLTSEWRARSASHPPNANIQERLARLSSRGRQQTGPTVSAVREVVNALR